MARWRSKFLRRPAFWLQFGAALVLFILITGCIRMGIGWSGKHMLAVCHGGVFYVETSAEEFLHGPFARRDRYWLDWTLEYGKMSSMSRYAFVPLWPLLIVPLVGAGISQIQKIRARPWLCGRCRYDMRGVVSGRCPECGAAAESGAAESRA